MNFKDAAWKKSGTESLLRYTQDAKKWFIFQGYDPSFQNPQYRIPPTISILLEVAIHVNYSTMK